ncbi:proton-conducting transporter membrane subunit [Aureimonas jatrophae]|uniref:Multicomponent Na+:H+ antiporter subunit D n=1 Tax=Aureimonas jatrophae TaxID=1166073 RepID=A0A1H0J9L8_9HYPH|nr:proton-conducting transporter membrane subunit [Aureimonas jatrophae]MBB3951530.1 multicomponent Na+:H+ antiporter subunit D [Aureimonas jatrophae]SDO40240.1 multicomponent Na+:H+ antiporter subunit D [Aureimonas jatrophae]
MNETQALIDAAMVTRDYTSDQALVVFPVLICFVFGAVLLMARRRMDLHPPIAVTGLALLLVADLALLARIAGWGPMSMAMGGWRPPFGISFTVDLLSALFLTVAGFAGLACGIYAVASIDEEGRRYGFFPFLFMVLGGVSGAFLTGDIFNLYVWFEVMLIGSFGLLILGSEREQLDGATKYGFLNLLGATLFLLTIGYCYGVFGTLNMADIALKSASLEGNGVLLTIASLFLVAFSMKAAAFPLNFWLPASYHTPRFVVSALFAGLLTKVGIYALIRVVLMLFPPERGGIGLILAWMAALTMLVGSLGALAQSDLRRLLNYVVIAGIGTILVGLAVPPVLESNSAAITTGAAAVLREQSGLPFNNGVSSDGPLATGLSGAIFYAVHSIVVMTALYLAAGVAAFRTGTSSLHEMGGMWRRHPLFSVLFLVLLLGVAGLPPFSGFWPKLLLVRASIAADLPWLATTVLVSGFLLTIASARIFALAFWRPLPVLADANEPHPHSEDGFRAPPPGRPLALVPLVALSLFVVAIGIWPEGLGRLSFEAAHQVLSPSAYLASVLGTAP